jgi:rubrerythrin
MGYWSLNDIDWQAFDRSKATPELISLAKSACMVEHNGYDYARYLCEVFEGDLEFQQAANDWAVEEVQHGQALRKWAELADPSFNFDDSFKAFTDGYKLPAGVSQSVRGSRSGELIARCVVESGTSTYYTAISEYADEPVLKQICAHIAADEFRHYKLFYTHLKRYLQKEKLGAVKRFAVAMGRIAESEDDELAYAYFTAHRSDENQEAYDRKLYTRRYMVHTSRIYRKEHIDRLTAMVMKAVGFKPNGWFHRVLGSLTWSWIQWRGAVRV